MARFESSGSNRNKPRRKSLGKETGTSGSGSASSAGVGRLLFEKPGDGKDKDAKAYHIVLPRERHSLLTGAVLGDIKTEKEDSAKSKAKPEAETTDAADRAESKEQPTKAEKTETAIVPDGTRTSSDSGEKAAAESKEDEDDRVKDGNTDGDTVLWVKRVEAEKSPPEGEALGGDIYRRLKQDEEERPADNAEATRSSAEDTAEPVVAPLDASAATARESVSADFGLHEQPLQQHQARDHETSPAGPEPPGAPPAAASGGSGETPPPGGPEGVAFGQPPEPERNRPAFVPVANATEQARQSEPAEVFHEYVRRDAEAAGYARAVSPAEPMVTSREANEQAYYAERTGQNRGLVTGLLVGGAYEHFKHKRREKKTTKEHQEQVRKLQDAQEAQTWAAKEQIQRQGETTRQLQSVEARLAAAEQRPQFQPLPPAEAARMAERQAKEQLRVQRVPEIQQPQITGQPAEQLAIPPEHRIESSAWHNIEVDTRTGRPVETPAFTYGREYHRERAHESTPLAQRNAAAGEVALAAATGGGAGGISAAGGGGAQSDDGAAVSSADIPNASMQGPPNSIRQTPPQPFSAPAPKSSHAVTPLWPYLVTLAAILICLVVLLH